MQNCSFPGTRGGSIVVELGGQEPVPAVGTSFDAPVQAEGNNLFGYVQALCVEDIHDGHVNGSNVILVESLFELIDSGDGNHDGLLGGMYVLG